MNTKVQYEGIFYGALSYVMWGFIPIYWKLLQHVSSTQILGHRVLWSFVFMIILLLISRKWASFINYVKEIAKNKKKLFALFIASLLVSANWGIFIWAVNAGRILDTSLGYYINPLISVLLGVTVLKEKLSNIQVISVCLAGIGVAILTFYLGSFPWISLMLAITFGLYGLAKVLINADATIGLTLETMMVTPIAIGYFVYLFFHHESISLSGQEFVLMIGGGVATALPLLLFAMGAKKMPLSMLGFLQYIAPTISLLVGVFMYHEEFTKVHLVAFLFIWSALVLYSMSQLRKSTRIKKNFDQERYGA
ncbi:EamA family transporter RarD [Bacillus massiliigorillae]|uniref:EamA family transporter RarD n=1 Tax=Bacillus massiliigorillae TaxID=1243664 RepID=UPI00039CC766|nr:EamA family transporter RarD [Bacillus massiliigorillae]